MTMPITSSIKDISLPEKAEVKFKNEETSAERIKRQKHEFFTLLTAQLKNQDPLSPMETNEMTQQIFAINHVEQQLETNKLLDEIKGYFSTSHNSAYLNYIGKLATFEGNEVYMMGDEAVLSYELTDECRDAVVQIKDRFGNVVDQISISPRKGSGSVKWTKKEGLENDKFTFSVLGVKHDDSKSEFKTFSHGMINSLFMEDGVNYFEINNRRVPASNIKKITDNSGTTNAYLRSILEEISAVKDNLES